MISSVKNFLKDEYKKYVINESRKKTACGFFFACSSLFLLITVPVYSIAFSNELNLFPITLQRGTIIRKLYYNKNDIYYGYNLIEYTKNNETIHTCINDIINNKNLTIVLQKLDTYNIGNKYIFNVYYLNEDETCDIVFPEMSNEQIYSQIFFILLVLLILSIIIFLRIDNKNPMSYKNFVLKMN